MSISNLILQPSSAPLFQCRCRKLQEGNVAELRLLPRTTLSAHSNGTLAVIMAMMMSALNTKCVLGPDSTSRVPRRRACAGFLAPGKQPYALKKRHPTEKTRSGGRGLRKRARCDALDGSGRAACAPMRYRRAHGPVHAFSSASRQPRYPPNDASLTAAPNPIRSFAGLL